MEGKTIEDVLRENEEEYLKVLGTFDAPKNISAYTAVTSQNWDKAVVSAIMTKNNKYSPLERLFTI